MPRFRPSSSSANHSKPIEAALYWHSPWSVVSQWWDCDQSGAAVARTYRDGGRVIVEIELAGVDPDQIALEAGSNRLHLRYPNHSRTIPLPFVINQESARADWKDGLLSIIVEQTMSDGQPLAESRREFEWW